jgi:hypothetical protein
MQILNPKSSVLMTLRYCIITSVADPGFLSRVKKIPDPGSGSASKSLSIFHLKHCFIFLRNMIWNVNPRSGTLIQILIFHLSQVLDLGVTKAPDPGSRIRILNIDSTFSL